MRMLHGPTNIAILGTGMTRFGRLTGDNLRSLSERAVAGALDDAGLQPRDVQMVLFGNAVEGVMHGQEMIRAEVALRHAGLHGVPMINVENACASSTSAFQLACMACSLIRFPSRTSSLCSPWDALRKSSRSTPCSSSRPE